MTPRPQQPFLPLWVLVLMRWMLQLMDSQRQRQLQQERGTAADTAAAAANAVASAVARLAAADGWAQEQGILARCLV